MRDCHYFVIIVGALVVGIRIETTFEFIMLLPLKLHVSLSCYYH